MAKRSIEIILSAENRTGSALQQAKAQLAGYASDVKRIQANIAAATRAGDSGAAAGQMGLLGGAQERQATLRQEVEGRAALSARLAAYKAEHAAIRASVGATEELAGSTARVAAESRKVATQTENGTRGVINFGKAVAAAHLIADGLRIGTAAIRGDWDAISENVRRLPFGVGEIASATEGLLNEVSGVTAEIAKMQEKSRTGGDYVRGMTVLGAIKRNALFSAKLSGMNEDDARFAVARKEEKDLVDKIWATPGSKRSRELAQQAVEDKYKAAEARISADRAKSIAEADAEQERRAAEEAWDATMRAEEEIRREQQREYERALEEEKADAKEAAKRIQLAPEIRDLRRSSGGFAAVDRGFLTQAPGSHYMDDQAAAQATAKQTAEMAKSLKKIEAGLMVEAKGEFLEWIRGREKVQVANF